METSMANHLDPNAWIQTFSGVRFFPFAPKGDDINIDDIAHSLSFLCRFTGHTRTFYSVAQHSLIVSAIVRNERARPWALMHDGAEAYIGDISSPMKKFAPDLKLAERLIQTTMRDKWAIPYDQEIADEVHRADLWLCYEEAKLLLPNSEVLKLWALRAELEKMPPFEPCGDFLDYRRAIQANVSMATIEVGFLSAFHNLVLKKREAA
jgi:5'-deoxynucleotidase YfbR-like HD superfamily hydrolase